MSRESRDYKQRKNKRPIKWAFSNQTSAAYLAAGLT